MDEKRQELFQFLMQNNEGIRNFQSDYKHDQDKKVQKIMQQYSGLIKLDSSQDINSTDLREDPKLTGYIRLHKQISAIQEVINLRVKFLLENTTGSS